jgi:hypothetical protein
VTHRLARGFVLTVVLAVTAIDISAHEIGAIRADLRVNDRGEYTLDFVVDPDGLLTKLEVYGGRPVSSGVSSADRDRRIVSLAPVFLSRVRLRIDDQLTIPHFDYLPPGVPSQKTSTESTVRLTGRVGASAQTLQVANGLALGAYEVATHIAGRQTEISWVTGTSFGPPILLGRTQAAKLATNLDYGRLGVMQFASRPEHLLFVVGLVLAARARRSLVTDVAMFSLACTAALGLTAYRLMRLPPRLAGPLLACSVAYIALETLSNSRANIGRLSLVGVSGLVHGAGLARALDGFGPSIRAPLAGALSFSVGAELGLVLILGAAWMVVRGAERTFPQHRCFIVKPSSLAIGIAGVSLAVRRVIGVCVRS